MHVLCMTYFHAYIQVYSTTRNTPVHVVSTGTCVPVFSIESFQLVVRIPEMRNPAARGTRSTKIRTSSDDQHSDWLMVDKDRYV